MKKRLLSVILILAAFLTACVSAPSQAPETTVPSASDSQPTSDPIAVTTAPSEPVTEPVTEPITEPPTQHLHSPLYIPNVSVEDVIRYFNEVCLDAEFVNEGDPSRLQKWDTPIRYILNGEPTSADLKTLSTFSDWLNTIEGFPGISETKDPIMANLRIHFCTQSEMTDLLGPNFSYMDGGVTFWYMDDAIYDAIICYRTDIEQTVRNSVILEEIYNGLGPVQDTDLRTDSIIYSGFSTPQTLTDVDKLILKLLYHPQLRCGMNARECETVIRQLYY